MAEEVVISGEPETEYSELLHGDGKYEFTFTKTLEDPEVKLEPVTTPTKKESKEDDEPNENTAEKRQKLNDGQVKKKKSAVRRLNGSEERIHKASGEKSENRWPFVKILFIAIPALIVVVAVGSERIRNELVENYQRRYNTLVHENINFCDQKFDDSDISAMLSKHLVGQQSAINAMHSIFQRHEAFTSIGIIGNTGVGKTYATQLIEAKFQWADNVQFHIWNTDDGKTQIEVITSKVIPKFNSCGHNLLFLDDLSYNDRNYIQTLNQLLKTWSKKHSIRLIVVYVFNLSKHTEMSQELAKSHANTLRLLENISVVEFDELTRQSIIKCIEISSDLLNVSLLDSDKADILSMVQESHSGCKNVAAKVALYAARK